MAITDYFELLPEEFSDQAMFKTDISTTDTGSEQRKSRWSSPRTSYSLAFPNAYSTQIDYIWDFYVSMKGAFEAFYLAVPPPLEYEETVSGAYTITLTGTTKPSPSNIKVFLDDVEIFDWTYTEVGTSIDFDNLKTGDIKVRYYEMKYVRFLNDNLSREWMAYAVTSQGIDFITA